MRKGYTFAAAFLATSVLSVLGPVSAAEVSADRLINADKEPQNWLMNHRTYDAQRYSPLDRINKANAKDLKLAYAVALGGTSANANLESTPLAEDGNLYVVDQWGVLYKIDGRSGDLGRILWRMDPGQEKLPLANRGAALTRNAEGMNRSSRTTCLSARHSRTCANGIRAKSWAGSVWVIRRRFRFAVSNSPFEPLSDDTSRASMSWGRYRVKLPAPTNRCTKVAPDWRNGTAR